MHYKQLVVVKKPSLTTYGRINPVLSLIMLEISLGAIRLWYICTMSL